ncbi:EamA family transporter [Puniceicoccaceae bacterium K14]|nr:EamA family transporter [Puniceicoccaceae bacterium K14]
MVYLIIVSCLWAFSFGLIGSRLSGLDSTIVAAVRLGLACVCFVPFLRLMRISWPNACKLIALGALQFGVMYVAYIRAYSYLPSYLVALFSVMTPLYVAVSHSIFERTFRWQLLACSALSILGAGVIKYAQPEGAIWVGFFLMQIANVAFGLGQVLYKRWKQAHPDVGDSSVFALMYFGAFLFSGASAIVLGNWGHFQPTGEQIWVLVYLGVVAAGIGFFLWNKGAAIVNAGTLAAFNNAVVPLAMATSLFVFGEIAEVSRDDLIKLTSGGSLIFVAIIWGRKTAS